MPAGQHSDRIEQLLASGRRAWEDKPAIRPEETPMPDRVTDEHLQRILHYPYSCTDGLHRQMAAELVESRARLAGLEAQADRVRQVHQPIEAVNMRHHPNGRLTRVCSGCGTDDGNWQIYPCPTIRALEETR